MRPIGKTRINDGGGARNGFSGDGRVAWLVLEEHFAAATKAAIHDACARLAASKLGNKEPPESFCKIWRMIESIADLGRSRI